MHHDTDSDTGDQSTSYTLTWLAEARRACLRMLVSKGAWKSRPYDVAKVGMRLSPRLMLLVLALTRCWRPELCMLYGNDTNVTASRIYAVSGAVSLAPIAEWT